MERSAGGRAVVTGHGSQQEALSCGVYHKEGHLDHAAVEGDGPVRGQKVDQQPGCDHRGVADIKEREDTEKKSTGLRRQDSMRLSATIPRFPTTVMT